MEHRHWQLLKKEREALYEQFLSATGEAKSDLLVKIMELDEEMEALERDQQSPVIPHKSKNYFKDSAG
ncbi:hypothetical protein [Natranaerobius thermophilus]|uniref:Uncharacterized protein n=1 Tax=Natranaerobius thermophilus (strain ATCC BAA-1301 / DSM 18059 / JW/NM-WN-LF) TaxID=457570 RepID=B2A8L9_NATTJ|nr:hypothetical protein [Natranaerobius thermophilus]ACB85903.1 hypothetical protein Nther_2338 [Natranaerobius thermophilus JW/NM-WN-LF]